MDRNSQYYKQVQLLVSVLPYVAKERCFALKGGTAINLFIQDFPRLSVDIDLAYMALDKRDEAIKNAREALGRIANNINSSNLAKAELQLNRPDEMRIIVTGQQAQIKVEVSPVMRGTLKLAADMDLIEAVEDEFGYANISVVSLPDLYGGKICAALDRQHPRDLFDVKLLLEQKGLSQGIDRDIFEGFITYLLSHPRPIAEVMAPRIKDIQQTFINEFNGMTTQAVSLEELQVIPEQLITTLKNQFTRKDYDFLLSFKTGEPDWELSPDPNIAKLPAVKWKLININKIPVAKKVQAIDKLTLVLDNWL
ncbi:nucleotidyl transferase AbiEii/AbiGii toxin family protein [Thalassotalea fusca]